nr:MULTISPECIES: diguanylate cyclase [Pseudooceanicola]
MHLVLDAAGQVVHAGPTLRRLRPGQVLTGRPFEDLFEVQRPQLPAGMAALLDQAGTRLHLRLRDHPRTGLKAVLVPLAPDDAGRRGAVVNLSFGISIDEALRDYSLHSNDFAPTDLAIEMLYLTEAKLAVLDSWKDLNQRLQGAKIAAEEQAYTDTLTGLKNRRAMDHVLARLIRAGEPFALMHLDLDWFKAVNDSHGHAAGDHVLQHVARALVDETRGEDTVARIGGDEFVLLFPHLLRRARIEEIAQRLIARLEKPILFGTAVCRVSCSMGTTLSSFYAAPRADVMLADADAALYASKKMGRAQHCFFRPRAEAG